MKTEQALPFANVSARLERLPMTRYQRMIFAIIATAWLFDSMDLAALTFVLGSIKAEFGLNSTQTGLLASASFVGMFLGAGVAGLLSDRFGRKPIFQISMVIWGVGSLMCGFATNYESLLWYRVVLGIGMGMELPIALAMVSEIVPTDYRGRYSAILEGFLPVGFVVGGTLIYFLLPAVGWRGVFMVLAVPAAFLFVIRRVVPESPRWLEARGNQAEADRVMRGIEEKVQQAAGTASLPPVAPAESGNVIVKAAGMMETFRELWAPAYAKRTAMLWIVWFFTLLGYYGLTSWLGALLQQAGYDVTKSVFYTIIISCAGIPGFMFAAWLLDAVGRKPASIGMLLCSALTAYVYGQCATHQVAVAWLITAGLFMQFFFFGMWCVIYAYTPELYPTRARATGAGIASSVGRLGSIVGPFGLGIALPVIGQGGVFAVGAGCFCISAVTILFMGTETRGLSLEKISH